MMIFGLMRPTLVLVAACGVCLLLLLATTYGEERDCSIPERFYTFEPTLTRTSQSARQRS